MTGKFIEVFGDSVRNRILEEFLENDGYDVAVSSICKYKSTSKPTTYEEIRKLEKQGIIKKSRIMGKTQLYEMNKEHLDVHLLKKTFMECLRTVAKECEIDSLNKTKIEKALLELDKLAGSEKGKSRIATKKELEAHIMKVFR